MKTMKQSNIEWIGKIPSDWDLMRLQFCLKEVNVKNNPIQTTQVLSLMKDVGVLPYEEKGDVGNKSKENVSEYRLAYPNTIVLNCMNILIGSVGISNYFGCVSPVYYVFKETDKCDLRFINYIFNTREFQKELRKYAKGILEIRLRVSADDIFKQKVPLPSKDVQTKIANFLDQKCSEIDSLSTDIQSQIDILEEYKKSIITEAVTKGLNPDVEMKDSGIKWIGMIPAHWDVDKGKYFLRYLQKSVKETDDVITCFRDGEVTLRTNRREDGFTISLKEIGYQGIDVGDLVVHGMDGFAGAIGISDSRGKASPVLNVLDADHNKKYLMYYLRNMAYNGVFIALATGIRVRTCDTGWNKLRELPYTLPPKNEQDEIANFIDIKCAEVDVVIADKKAQLETLAEYKKSLIYEYVTGKKEVPENV